MRAALIALSFLAACAAPSETGAPPSASPPQTAEDATAQDTCGMARFRLLIGTDASAIDRSTLPPRTRIITPGMMVTQDFSAERLNIMTGVDGKVSSMRCF